MKSPLFAQEFMENQSQERFTIHQKKMLKAILGPPVLALKGSMVAFQGNVEFHHKSAGGVGKWLKANVTGEDTPLMTVSGQGDVFFADKAKDIFSITLENDGVSVNGSSILAFDANLEYNVQRVKGAGMMTGGAFNTVIQGAGQVFLTSDGQPLILDCSQTPTCVDINAAICWSANLQPQIRNSMNMKSMLRGGSGEAFQYVFHGPGFVVVQPSELADGVPAHSHNNGGGLSSLLS